MYPWVFHCDISLDTQRISLRNFIRYPAHFIAIFQMYPWVFHCDFSNTALGISLRFFKCSLGYFIVILNSLKMGNKNRNGV
jgi:hypothetical protein